MIAYNSVSHASVAMQDAWQVLQHWRGDAAGQAETAVVAALSFWDYSLVANVPGSDTYKATGRCFSVAAGRISYSYGLKGFKLIILPLPSPPTIYLHMSHESACCCPL